MYLQPKKLNGIESSIKSDLEAGNGILIESNLIKIDDTIVAKDSEAVLLASNNTFTGTNTFDKTLTIGASDKLVGANIYGNTTFFQDGDSATTFNSKVVIKSYAAFVKEGEFSDNDVFDELKGAKSNIATLQTSTAKLESDNTFSGTYNKFTGDIDKRNSVDDSGVLTVNDNAIRTYEKLEINNGIDVLGGDFNIQTGVNINGTYEIKRDDILVFDRLIYLWRYNVLREDWTNVDLNSSITAGIGNNPISVVTGAGKPPNVQFLKIPYVKTTGSLPLQYIIKARGVVNLGGATANGDTSTAKSVLLTTITNTQLIPKYTYSFTVNGFSGARRARVDLYGTEHPTETERGKMIFVFGGSDLGIQHIDLSQLEWMTN